MQRGSMLRLDFAVISLITLELASGDVTVVRAQALQSRVWYSSESTAPRPAWIQGPQPIPYMLSEQPPISFEKAAATADYLIRIDPELRHQPIEGIGSSLEESTVFNLMRMSPDRRRSILRDLFDPKDGLRMDMMRICIGSSDFTARDFYTYNDLPPGETDPALEHFSIQKDIDYHIIEVLQEALEINPDLRFVASPWSPPGWMKTSGSIVGGSFRSEFTDVYARYLRMFVAAYAEHGIPIHAMTLQNEPLYVPPDYPGCHMTAEQQRDLAVAVRRELDAHGFDTRILIYDHNFDRGVEYASAVLEDAAARDAIYGTAFHSYAGHPDAMSELHAMHPDRAIWFTERTYWGADGMGSIADLFRNWSRTYVGWVTMLDSNLKPEQWTGTPGPTWLIQNAGDPDDVWYTAEYYLIGQFTRFVSRGAHRIESIGSSATGPVNHVAFASPDGSVVLVVTNASEDPRSIGAMSNGRHFTDVLPAKTVATYVWRDD